MPGATIILKSTTIGITSNETGDFTLLLPAKDSLILLVSFIGYETQEIKVQGDREAEYTDEDRDECFGGCGRDWICQY